MPISSPISSIEEQKVTHNSKSFPVSQPDRIQGVQRPKRVLSWFTAIARSSQTIVMAAGVVFANTLTSFSAAQAATIENLSLVSGWVPYGGGYASPTVVRDNGIVSVGGVIRSGSWSYLAQLPSGAAPTQRLIFQVNNHDKTTRVDVLSSGHLLYSGGSSNHGWVSLEGITFVSSGGTPLTLLNGWSNYGYGFAPLTVAKVGNTVVLQGLIRNGGNWNTSATIAQLPEGMRPSARMVFGGSVHTSAARIDVLPNGDVVYVSGKTSWDWLSLSGIAFTVGDTTPFSLASGWSNYGNGFALPGVATSGAVRPFGGVLTGNTGQIGTLPSGITGGRRIFSMMKGDKPSRVDLLTDGRLFHIAGGAAGSSIFSLSSVILP
jgi:hypothetical protein